MIWFISVLISLSKSFLHLETSLNLRFPDPNQHPRLQGFISLKKSQKRGTLPNQVLLFPREDLGVSPLQEVSETDLALGRPGPCSPSFPQPWLIQAGVGCCLQLQEAGCICWNRPLKFNRAAHVVLQRQRAGTAVSHPSPWSASPRQEPQTG